MKKLFIAFLLFFQISPAFSYDENDFIKKINSLNTTFTLQSTNFFSEFDKMEKLLESPKINDDHLDILYVTTTQSLCITVITLEKTQRLIRENPQAIGSVLTREDVNTINYKTDEFREYLSALRLDNQGCKKLMPYTYDSMMNS